MLQRWLNSLRVDNLKVTWKVYSVRLIIVVRVCGKFNANRWEVAGTHSPEWGGGVDRLHARYTILRYTPLLTSTCYCVPGTW